MNQSGVPHGPPKEMYGPPGGINGPPAGINGPPSEMENSRWGVNYSQNPPGITLPVGPFPASMVCPSCRAQIVSRIDYVSSSKTHIIACITCLVCCPFMCVPYCIKSCKNANHYCPYCNAYLGTYSG